MTARSRDGETSRRFSLLQETGLLLGIALVLAVVIKTFLLQAFYIPSESMEPGLVKNDRILVEKPSYWQGTPERGDVVVFEDPGSWLGPEATQGPDGFAQVLSAIGLYPSGGHLVKRVIGVEGDVISCCDARGRLRVNGKPVAEEHYVKQENGLPCNGPMTGDCSWKAGPVPEGNVFVMGDNRWHSADSSVHMCSDGETDCVPGRQYVPVDSIVGRVFSVAWPVSHWRWVTDPESFGEVPASS